ncbi:MAG: 4Fe-4S binding protein [Lachnospiraceae bacterium]|jgi:2-oxoglutarate ferredoxin oxidoreductase subunit delta|nr:4Fe-4S binding protein [Lachnospiraceae bacterium]
MAKFTVTFNETECKGCELCVAACPKNIIALNPEITNDAGYNPASIADMENCIGCQSCARMCPDCIITIVKND